MSRQLRIEYPYAFYHVMSHGNGFQWIYKTEKNFIIFLKLLNNLTIKYQFVIHTFILMRNHYHLLLETPMGNLSQGMLYFNREFARIFNLFEKRKGSVFKQRYKSILIEKGVYYKRVYRYINQNSQRAGICQKIEEYPGGIWYYSHQLKVRKIINKIINWKNVQINLGIANQSQILKWLNEKVETKIANPVNQKYFLCSKKWLNEIRKQHLHNKVLSEEIIEQSKLKNNNNNNWKIFKKLHKYKNEKEYLNIIIYILSKYSSKPYSKIAQKLGLKNSNQIRQRLFQFKKRVSNNKQLQILLGKIERYNI